MMKWILICVLLLTGVFIGNTSFSYPPASGEIKWSADRVLSYGDFEAHVPSNTPWAALTSSNIYFTYQTSNGRLSSFVVYASFIKKNSWIKIKNEAVLNHEQLHFNITEAFTRKLYKQIAIMRDGAGNVQKEASALFKQVNSECDAMQQQYDEETKHGTKPGEQQAWKKRVDDLLSDYDPYPQEQ